MTFTNRLEQLTFNIRIASRVQWRAVALGLIVRRNSAHGLLSAGELVALVGLLTLAQTALPWISHAARLTRALVPVGILATDGVFSAGILRAAVLLQWLALLAGISEESGRARALSLAVHDATLSIQAARVMLQARVGTLSGDTLLVQFAVFVRLAFVLDASFPRITLETVRTQAQRLVIGNLADGILSTGLSSGARVDTLLIRTRSLAWTVRIRSTTCHAGSILTQLSSWTRSWVTLGTASAALAGLSAGTVLGLSTLVSAVNSFFVTVAVRVALLRWWRARHQRITEVSTWAAALNSMVHHRTLRARATLSEHCARIRTLLVDTGLIVRAVVVGSASGLADSVLANQPVRARSITVAHRSARSSNTAFICQAVLIVSASLHTRVSVASLSLRAITSRLTRTLLRSTSHQRISDQWCRTDALLAMIRYRTNGVRSTSRRLLAWINALLIHTGQLSRTSCVRPASNHTRLSLTYFSSTTVVISSTNRLASSSIASFVVQASLIVGTNWSAHVLDTGRSVRAVSVLGTLQRWGPNTANLGRRTRNHTVDARTARSMVHDRTGRVRSARTIAARICAAVVAARFASTTVVVRVASVHASSVQADVSQEAVVVQAARYCKKIMIFIYLSDPPAMLSYSHPTNLEHLCGNLSIGC